MLKLQQQKLYRFLAMNSLEIANETRELFFSFYGLGGVRKWCCRKNQIADSVKIIPE